MHRVNMHRILGAQNSVPPLPLQWHDLNAGAMTAPTNTNSCPCITNGIIVSRAVPTTSTKWQCEACTSPILRLPAAPNSTDNSEGTCELRTACLHAFMYAGVRRKLFAHAHARKWEQVRSWHPDFRRYKHGMDQEQHIRKYVFHDFIAAMPVAMKSSKACNPRQQQCLLLQIQLISNRLQNDNKLPIPPTTFIFVLSIYTSLHTQSNHQ